SSSTSAQVALRPIYSVITAPLGTSTVINKPLPDCGMVEVLTFKCLAGKLMQCTYFAREYITMFCNRLISFFGGRKGTFISATVARAGLSAAGRKKQRLRN